jgi:uncharacterized alkaline shock family protein YloU
LNIFNRIIVTLGLLTIMIVSATLFIASGPVIQSTISFLQQIEANLAVITGPNLVLRWVGGLIFVLLVWAVCAALLWLEVRRPRGKTIMVQRVSGGQAELTTDSISSRLEYNIDQLAEVVRVKPRVSSGRKGVRIELEVETNPEIEVPAKSEEIQHLTKDIVENRMGLQLESVRVLMRHAPYPKSLFKSQKPEAATQAAKGLAITTRSDAEQLPASPPDKDVQGDVSPEPSPTSQL